MAAERRRVLYRGRVQAVGFRWTTRRIAARHQVSGWVRNLPDGLVELVAEGEPSELEAFLQEIRQHFSANIDEETQSSAEATGEFAGFSIRRGRM